MLELCSQDSIRPCSVDLRLGKIFKVEADGVVDFESNLPKAKEISLPHTIKKGEFVLGSTIERMNQKHTKYAAIAIPRSRAYRVGLHIACGLIHPHYRGELIFGIKNLSNHSIHLKQGDSLIQLAFFDVASDCVPLPGMYQDGRII